MALVSFNGDPQRGHGIINDHINTPGSGINHNSRVVASITELTDPGGRPFLGDASLSVLSVAPNDDGTVDLKININWGSDLNYRVSILADT
ncbi:MAG: hypothetical protein WA323_23220 [Candidatus Nitrosopolaris sp.]